MPRCKDGGTCRRFPESSASEQPTQRKQATAQADLYKMQNELKAARDAEESSVCAVCNGNVWSCPQDELAKLKEEMAAARDAEAG